MCSTEQKTQFLLHVDFLINIFFPLLSSTTKEKRIHSTKHNKKDILLICISEVCTLEKHETMSAATWYANFSCWYKKLKTKQKWETSFFTIFRGHFEGKREWFLSLCRCFFFQISCGSKPFEKSNFTEWFSTLIQIFKIKIIL